MLVAERGYPQLGRAYNFPDINGKKRASLGSLLCG